MYLYGKNVAKEILNDKQKFKTVKKIFLQEDFRDKSIIALIENKNLNINILSKKEIDGLHLGNHQGIILDVSDYQYYSLDEIDLNEVSFLVMLDHIEDPHNLGAIIRTCEASGVDAIIIPKDRQVDVNGTVMRTSVGTASLMKIIRVSNLSNTIEKLKDYGFWIVGTALENSIDYRKIDYSGKNVLIIGNEGTGLSKLITKKCDFIAKIPMYGKTNSLNASVAAGIMIYEMIRDRK